MAKRQIGKCEAIYRAIPTFHLQGANIACVFVQSGFPENQSTFLRKVRPKENGEQISTDNLSRNSDSSGESDIEDDFQERELKFRDNGQELIKIPGRKGTYVETERIHDKYAARPEGVNSLTLSQFATSYAKCKKKPNNIKFDESGVTEEKGNIIDHLTDEPLPRYIR